MLALRKRIKQLNTEFNLENTMCCTLAEWFIRGHVSLYEYPEKFPAMIWSQGTIEWRQTSNGEIPRHWLERQSNTKPL